MRRWTGSSLVQVMACRLFGTKPLAEPMLACSQLDSWEQLSVKFKSEFYHFHSRKFIWKCRLPKWQPFCPAEVSWQNSHMTKAHSPVDILPCRDDISAVWHDGSCQMPVVTFRLMYAMHEQIPYFMCRVTEDLGPCRGDKPGVILGYGITNTTSTGHYVW